MTYNAEMVTADVLEFLNPTVVCSKLLDNNQPSVTDPATVLELYFSALASSALPTNASVSSVEDD